MFDFAAIVVVIEALRVSYEPIMNLILTNNTIAAAGCVTKVTIDLYVNISLCVKNY